ncbi:MAG TPA: hypothetical protein VIM11_28390 [Tepidisphaeraceae bacterium]
MTQLEEPPRSTDQAPRRRDVRAGRLPVVAMLIISLVASGLTRNWASNWKDEHSGNQSKTAERGVLSGMNSYALALMLGGLRGPLVMVLWSKVESQKIDRDLEDMDTMIEWIRLLQPEFDTVHIFQIWNKAYNISVMMASTAAKYQTILDAVDYGRHVDQDRPGDLNINDSLARVFAEKLGGKNVAEHLFYRKQFRQDTMTESSGQAAYPEEQGKYRRMGFKFVDSKKMGPILDDQNNLLPQFTTPLFDRPSDLAGNQWNDGSELQYLKKYEPFPYGVPPTAMGYNYAKRAEVAMTVGGQRPLQISDTVVDSRPGLMLKQWAEEEAERAVNSESRALGAPREADGHVLELSTAPATPDAKIPDPHALQSAIYSYQLTARICADALNEYERHLANPQYVNPYQTYTSHLEELRSMQILATADAAYARAMAGPSADRAALLRAAATNYREVRAQYERMLLRYATEEAVAGPLYRNNKTIDLDRMNPEDLHLLFIQMLAKVAQLPKIQREYDEPRDDYGSHINRADARLRLLAAYDAPSILQIH